MSSRSEAPNGRGFAITVTSGGTHGRVRAAVRGEIDAEGAPALRQALTAALRSGNGLDLDLGDAVLCDPSGPRVMEELRSQAVASHRTMTIRNADPPARALLAAHGCHDLLADGEPPDGTDTHRPELLTRVRETLVGAGYQTSPADTDGAPGLSIEERARGIAVAWAATVGLSRPAPDRREPQAPVYPGIDSALHAAVVVALTNAGFLIDDVPDEREVMVTGEQPAPQEAALVDRATVLEAVGVVAAVGRLTPGQSRRVLVEVSRKTGIPLLRLAEQIVEWADGGGISTALQEQFESSLARREPRTPPAPHSTA
ncbi:STAS domain-containing protein [Streptomyces formicae]|uniref:STAS domain-containing protein n=1 Tax=Streptomyces formicae TaxID=1616117 RepID=A0ABY3WPD6_9ACTN|nr:STAS domain-containing protein [Streptomyces formicae]UNM13451.1 STAS domain-containing protein [Streptomyces formicae]